MTAHCRSQLVGSCGSPVADWLHITMAIQPFPSGTQWGGGGRPPTHRQRQSYRTSTSWYPYHYLYVRSSFWYPRSQECAAWL